MAFAGERRTNPLFAVSAIGLCLFGLMLLVSSVNRRMAVNRVPPQAQQLWKEGYGGIISHSVPNIQFQYVVVTKERLNGGDQIIPEFVELRTAQWVVDKYPEFELAGAKKDPKKPLVEGFYESVDKVVDKYAALDLPAGTPLLPNMLLDKNPFANRSDVGRSDRFSIAMAEEPTLYQLLRPGDRVDIMVVLGEETVIRAVRDVRVVAVNNLVTTGSGLLSAEAEAKLSTQDEAARRRKLELEAQARQKAKEQPDAQDKDQTEQDKAEDKAAEGDQAAEKGGEEDEGEAPPGTFKVGRKWDGRTITVQVSRREAMILAMTHNTPGIRLDLAVHHRR